MMMIDEVQGTFNILRVGNTDRVFVFIIFLSSNVAVLKTENFRKLGGGP